MKYHMAICLCAALTLGPLVAFGQDAEIPRATILPYPESKMTDELAARCPEPGQLFEVSYVNDAPQDRVVIPYFDGAEQRVVRVRRGDTLTVVPVWTDADPIDVTLHRLEYHLQFVMVLCETELLVTLVDGEFRLDATGEGLQVQEAWSFDQLAEVSGEGFSMQLYHNLLRPNSASQDDEPPSFAQIARSTIRFEAMRLPLTVYSQPSGKVFQNGSVQIWLPSISVVIPIG
jgi:hypothetical protein